MEIWRQVMDNFPRLIQETTGLNKKAALLIPWDGFLHFPFVLNYSIIKPGPKENQPELL